MNTGNEKKLLELSRDNNEVKSVYKDLLANDYILYLHKNSISRFCKRDQAYLLFTKEHKLNRYKNVLYKLEEPFGREINHKTPSKLIVIFTKMPAAKPYDSAKIPYRMLPPFFDNLERTLLKNVYTMRIMDLNVSHGSHYINTKYYPEYENEIKGAIESVQNNLGIDSENIVLYGGSKGGTGVIYHGAALDLKTIAADPIVNIGGKLEQNDRRFLKDNRTEDFVPLINKNLSEKSTNEKHVICSEEVPLYYNETKRLDKEKINIINIKDEKITSHPEVSRNTVPEQLTILNILLGLRNIW
ncbi:accessory Sec system protein Asp2 [Staphylococcus gallinarum]|uniref:accessory Sec system protein Asp2 n=1 Tax=Staphylococcus gallinarum TaxID=1293 RepID=UPI0030C28585